MGVANTVMGMVNSIVGVANSVVGVVNSIVGVANSFVYYWAGGNCCEVGETKGGRGGGAGGGGGERRGRGGGGQTGCEGVGLVKENVLDKENSSQNQSDDLKEEWEGMSEKEEEEYKREGGGGRLERRAGRGEMVEPSYIL